MVPDDALLHEWAGLYQRLVLAVWFPVPDHPVAAAAADREETRMSKTKQHADCVVIGAGPAGLAASAALTERGIEHLVLERGRVGETWRTQRWDSFRLNTPSWANRMLGEQPRGACLTGAEVVGRLEKLAADCPVREGVGVAQLTRCSDGFALRTANGDVRTRTVVVATRDENVSRMPALATAFPDRIAQYHAADYRNPGPPV